MKHPEFLNTLEQWNPDVIVVTAFGRILPKIILELPSRGCINVHASLLPSYRGAAPIQWATINGDSQTGITTMLMDEGMDTGAILLQEPVSIYPEETAGELAIRLASVGGALLIRTLREWMAGEITPRVQDDTKATMAPLLKKEDGIIPWDRSAIDIVNRIRGLSPWPGAYTFYQGDRLTIWKAAPQLPEVNEESDTSVSQESQGKIVKVGKQDLLVQTGQGLVAIKELQAANRKRMSTEQFLSGYHIRPGIKLTGQPVLPGG